MQILQSLLVAGLLTASVEAHSGPDERLSKSEIVRRSAMAKRCASAVGDLNQQRYAKRMMKKRALEKRFDGSGRNSTVEITTEAPYYEVLQNDTCVLTPEVTVGPYIWSESQVLRQDMTEDQVGVPLWLDVGVMDMATCEPLEDVLVDLWHCNATGSYSSFEALNPNIAFPTLLEQWNLTDTFESGVTDIHTGNTTWLRGMWPTDKNGMAEMKTIFPGFYIARAIHLHAQVHTDWTLHSNGTLSSGNTVSTGQIYFTEKVSEAIMALEPYSQHTQVNRTTLSEDTIFDGDTVGGYNPIINIVPVDGEDISKGMIGYITIGVDTTAIE